MVGHPPGGRGEGRRGNPHDPPPPPPKGAGPILLIASVVDAVAMATTSPSPPHHSHRSPGIHPPTAAYRVLPGFTEFLWILPSLRVSVSGPIFPS